MPPALIAGAVGVVAGVGAGAIKAKAAKKAGKVQSAAADKSAELQQETAREGMALSREQYQQTRQDLSPWRTRGEQASNLYGGYLGLPQQQPTAGGGMNTAQHGAITPYNQGGYLGQEDLTMDEGMPRGRGGRGGRRGVRHGMMRRNSNAPPQTQTGALQGEVLPPAAQQPAQQPMDFKQALELNPQYGFLREEGMRGIEGRAAARGSLQSGQTMKALSRFNQNLAYGMSEGYLNRLQGVSGQGQNAAAQTGAFGAQAAGQQAGMAQQMGRGMGQAYQTGAGAQAAGYLGAADAWGGAIKDVGSTVGGYLGYSAPSSYGAPIQQQPFDMGQAPELDFGGTPQYNLPSFGGY